MNHLDIYSGAGCFAIAAEHVWQEEYHLHSFVEFDPFCQKWLRANWPGCKIHTKAEDYKHDGTTIDLLTGGPPCQPVSIAGKKKGDKDDRWQWPTMHRIIQDVKPSIIVFENVYNIININDGLLFDGILTDMENEGYETASFIIPACSQNAPHRRDRVFVVANSILTGAGNKHREATNEKRGTTEAKSEIIRQGNRPAGANRINAGGSNVAYPDKHGKKRDKSENGERGRAVERGKNEPMGFPIEQGLEGHPRNEPEGREPGRIAKNENRSSSKTGGGGDVVDANEFIPSEKRIQQSGEFSRISRNPWEDSEWITGHDGKARRVKPGIRLLVDGYPYRNDLLRLFGNAIVPQVVVPIMQAIKEVLCQKNA